MIEPIYALFLEKSAVKINPGVPRGCPGLKENPEESEDH